MPAHTYKTICQKDSVNQRFYLAVIDETGAEHPEYGKLELKLGDIRTILAAAGAITLVDATKPAGAIRFTEVEFCPLGDGTRVFGIVPVGGFYTKPA